MDYTVTGNILCPLCGALATQLSYNSVGECVGCTACLAPYVNPAHFERCGNCYNRDTCKIIFADFSDNGTCAWEPSFFFPVAAI